MAQPNGATNKAALDFNAMIQADREKRKAETLAKEIFGRNRRQSAPAANGGIRKPGTGGSLASRIGPVKQQKPVLRQPVASRGRTSVTAAYARASNAPASKPVSNLDKAWTHDLHALHSPVRNGIPTGPKSKSRAARLGAAINTASAPNLNTQVNLIKGTANGKGQNNGQKKNGFSIKGIAGPCIVQAQNFVQGTTVADIHSALGSMHYKALKVTLLATSPMVIAEMVIESRELANAVVRTFNGQTADGNILQVFIKPGEVTPEDLAPSPAASAPSISSIPSGPRSQRRSDNSSTDQSLSTNPSSTRPDVTRERVSDNYRPDYNRDSRAEVVDGSYGFAGDERMEMDEAPRQMYSDAMINSQQRAPSGPAQGNGGRNYGRRGGRGGYGGYR